MLQECLSHSAVGRTVLTGTPNLISNHIEAVFARSTANEWRVPCPACGHQALLDQRVIGDTGLICPQCLSGIDVNQGQWQARNPDSDWGDGYHICHLMVPWVTIADIRQKQADYDAVRFQNEVLGLPTDLGDHLITREQIERCCEPRPMASSLADIPGQFRAALIAGIDWGGSSAAGTVLVIGCLRPNMVFAVYRFDRWRPGSDPDHVCDQVAAICRRFRVQLIAADGGGQGHIYDRLLFKKIGFQLQFWELFYSGSDQQPRPDGALMNWTINRTASIAALFARLKNDQIKFPRAEDCRGFLDEFVNEVAIYDQHMRTVRYDHAPGHPDDALHATNYVHALALRIAHAHH